MNYLGRPVFEFAIDWSDPVNKVFDYDLRAVAAGFGVPTFNPLQSHTVQGFEVTLQLASHDAINQYDAFIDALSGRLIGFWLPAPFMAGEIVNVVDTTHFDIRDRKLASTWNEHPDVYLFFLKDGQA